jgi:UDPglucose 6-dehydrogenase
MADENGRLCFAGVWEASSGLQFNRSCFRHMIKDGNIYQKRLPDGEWYIFRHDPPKEGDQKLIAGDEIEKKKAAAKAGQCGTYMYWDKKAKACIDARDRGI